jgi:cytochrome P450
MMYQFWELLFSTSVPRRGHRQWRIEERAFAVRQPLAGILGCPLPCAKCNLMCSQKSRRVFTNVLTERKCNTYLPIQEKEAVYTLWNLAQRPDTMEDELHRYSLSVARSISFGLRIRSSSDPFALRIKTLMAQFADAMTPGKYLVESVPWLGMLPRFMQPWLAELERIRDYEHEFNLVNFRDALSAAEKRPGAPCIAADLKKQMETSSDIDEDQAAALCSEILGAGSETTATSLMFVIMALVLNPEVQAKAHEELDRVVGSGRLPSWADEPHLPYVRAIIKEQHRWRTIAPLSMLLKAFPMYFQSCLTLSTFST